MASRYLLGHSPRELERLAVQARLIDPITRRFWVAAGIAPGMRVLDVGCGIGDVSFLVADLVGPGGSVVGVDRAAVALAAAQARAGERNLRNVTFVEGDPATSEFPQRFDAIVGRYVLMFQPDPVAMLRGILRHAQPGAIVAFHEPEWSTVHSHPPVPAYDDVCRWMIETLRASGIADDRMGTRLHACFVGAGLASPTMRLETVIGGGANASDALHLKADLARTMLPEIARLGIATEAEVDIETLADRIRTQMIERDAVIIGRGEVGAWSRT